jgi:hypothetical protein
MNIVLVELEYRGHHISLYLKSIANEVLSRGYSLIIITTLDAKKSGLFSFLKKKKVKFFYIDNIEYPKTKNIFYLMKFQINNFFLVKNIFKKIINIYEVNHVYLNTLDFFDKAIAILGSPFEKIPFSGLYLNPKFYNEELYKFKSNPIKNYFLRIIFLILILNKKLINVFLVDKLYEKKLKNKNFFKKKIVAVNDFSLLNDNYYSKINTSKKKIILIFGSIKFNKGIYELLNFFKTYTKNNIKILIVGKQNYDVKLFVNNFLYRNPLLKKKILVINKYFKCDSSYINYFKRADYVWVGYSNNFFGSSGVFFSACKMKKPVIINSKGLVYWYNKKYKVGYSLNFSSQKSLNLFFNSIDNGTIKKIDKKKFDFVNRKHSLDNFSKIIADKILAYK